MPTDPLDRREFLGRLGRGAVGLAGTAGLMNLTTSCSDDDDDGGNPKPLNFVFVLIDDMGWTDLACFGSGYYETPNIDALADQGMKFTNAYAACTVCSPTRAALMTGKYPARLHLTDWIAGHTRNDRKCLRPPFNQQLPLAEVTIAEALGAQGYATAHIGKWHLGDTAYYPDQQGFDINIAGTHRGQPHDGYTSPYSIPTLDDGPAGEYLTDRMGQEAVDWIDAHKDDKFFLYLSHFAVHTPVQSKDVYTDYYTAKATSGGHTKPQYAGMIHSVDDTIGQVMTKLNDLGIADRTVIVFTSDNGGLTGQTSNSPLRAGKGTNYEGGVRVPGIVKWPGVTAPGSTSDVPVITCDFYPTICEIAGVALPGAVDGESIVPVLRRNGSPQRSCLFWHYPHHHTSGGTPHSAVRKGDHKLIISYETNSYELFDLANDIGETTNLVSQMPAKAKELRAELFAHLVDCDADLPLPNPAWAGTWTRADVDFWTDLCREGLVPDTDLKKVIELYRG